MRVTKAEESSESSNAIYIALVGDLVVMIGIVQFRNIFFFISIISIFVKKLL